VWNKRDWTDSCHGLIPAFTWRDWERISSWCPSHHKIRYLLNASHQCYHLNQHKYLVGSNEDCRLWIEWKWLFNFERNILSWSEIELCLPCNCLPNQAMKTAHRMCIRVIREPSNKYYYWYVKLLTLFLCIIYASMQNYSFWSNMNIFDIMNSTRELLYWLWCASKFLV
jgi:hypothetical protein